jgi:hypothetical protein
VHQTRSQKVKRLLIFALGAVVFSAAPAAASGWTAYYDCGHGIVPIFGGWHGKSWLSGVEADHKIILGTDDADQVDMFQDLGMDVREGEEPTSLNADKTVFDFKVKWRGKTMILRWRSPCSSSTSCARNSNAWADAEVSLDGKASHSMGDGRYEDTEAYKYDEEGKKGR